MLKINLKTNYVNLLFRTATRIGWVRLTAILVIASIGGYFLLSGRAATTLRADFNSDRAVGVIDLSILASNWGGIADTRATGDANGDSSVNITDLSILSSEWGQTEVTPTPTATATPTATPTPTPSGGEFSFVVFGDNRPGSSTTNFTMPTAYQKIVDSMVAFSPRPLFALAVGDYTYVETTDTTTVIQQKYDAFKAVLNKLTAVIKPVYLTPGNHERLSGATTKSFYQSNFADTSLYGPSAQFYYSFNSGNVHFISLCTADCGSTRVGYISETSSSNSAQAKWMVGDLQNNTKPFTVVFLHHPLFDPKPGSAFDTTAKPERDALNVLFDKYGVDIVLQGDVHYYRRHQEPNGVVYLTQAQGGAGPLDSNGNNGAYSSLCNADGKDLACYGTDNSTGASYTIFTSNGSNSVTAVTYHVNRTTGEKSVLDSFTLNQNPGEKVVFKTSPSVFSMILNKFKTIISTTLNFSD